MMVQLVQDCPSSYSSFLESCSKSKDYDMNLFTAMAEDIFRENPILQKEIFRSSTVKRIQQFCIYANSIQFDFARKDFKIIIPKIDISLFSAK
jgi:hypothetical protein